MPALCLPLGRDVPLYTGYIEADLRTMNRKRAEDLPGPLSYPSKMEVAALCMAATRLRVGALLTRVEGPTCKECSALEGTFRFKNVHAILDEKYKKLWNILWNPGMAVRSGGSGMSC